MKIVQGDNHGMAGESPGHNEAFLLWPMSEDKASRIVAILNEDATDYSSYWYRIEDDDYTLLIFEP